MSFRKCTVMLVCLLAIIAQGRSVSAAPAADAIRRQLAQPPSGCMVPSRQAAGWMGGQLERFYQQRQFRAVWSGPRLAELYQQLAQLADDGLNPADYSLQRLQRLSAAGEAQAACLDVLASEGYLQALHDLSVGRLDPAQVQPMWYAEGSVPYLDPNALLDRAAQGLDDLPGAFDRARPAFPLYRQLRQAYAQLRRQGLPVWQPLPGGAALHPGDSDPRVPLLRQRLMAEHYLPQPGVLPAAAADPGRYDEELVAALQAFQRRHLLEDDGILGRQTLAELNRPPAERMAQLRVNLERMRWLARLVEPTSVLVDVAGAQISYYREGRLVWHARVQVGRPERATPLLKSYITHLTLNPTWTVPPTIWREDKLPAIRGNPQYLAENHMQVIDAQGRVLDPGAVDWSHPGAIRLRQQAGPYNPLGRVAIRFDNPFAVYLHDTPSQRLFDHLPRTFSSGCVRIENVGQLIDQLLADETPQQRARLAEHWASGMTRRADLSRAIPVVLAYWTAQANADGELTYRPDLYGLDAKVLQGLNAGQPG